MIYREPRDSDHTFTRIANRSIDDRRLSIAAMGLLVWMLRQPDDWVFHIGHMVRSTGSGRAAIRTALAELERFGYVVRGKQRVSAGQFGPLELDVYENPQARPSVESEHGDSPHAEIGHGLNRDDDKSPGRTDDRIPSTVNGPLLTTYQPTTDEKPLPTTDELSSSSDSRVLESSPDDDEANSDQPDQLDGEAAVGPPPGIGQAIGTAIRRPDYEF